ncbi:MAG: FecR family protein [Flavobacteriaceae bacterium]|nr:FecR family protein [Flavobacteriaceae bacterium]
MDKNISHKENETFFAQWMEGEITDSELKKLVSEADYLAFHKLKEGIDALAYLEAPLNKSFSSIQNKIDKKRKSKVIKLKRYWVISVAASIILFFGLFSMLNNSNEIIITSISEQKTIQLLDGSEVVLNADSKLQYDKDSWEENREVELEGEAFFKVEKGSTFTVKTDNGAITVLGTQFNVNSNLDFFEVVCYEGKVQVNNDSNNYLLTQSESFRRINGNSVEQWNTDGEEPTWLDGEISFKSVPLKYVISALEKQYLVKFDTTKINAKTIFTGSFSSNDLEIALQSVFKTMRIDYTKNDKNEYVLRHNK